MAFHCVPSEFLVAILCALMVLSLRVSGAHSVCAALAWRCYSALLMPGSLCANATDDHGVCTTTLVPAHGSPIALFETLLRGYGDHTAPPLRSIRTLSEPRATVFVLSMLKARTVALHSMRSNRVQWRCNCVAAVMLSFVLRTPVRSAFLGRCGIASRTPPWRDRSFSFAYFIIIFCVKYYVSFVIDIQNLFR